MMRLRRRSGPATAQLHAVSGELDYLLGAMAIATWALALAVATVVSVAAARIGLARAVVQVVLRASRRLTARQRHRVPGPPIESPYRLRNVLKDPATWRDLTWQASYALTVLPAGALSIALWVAGALALMMPLARSLLSSTQSLAYGIEIRDQVDAWSVVPVGVAFLLGAYGLTHAVVRLDITLSRALLATGTQASLSQRVAELTETRAETIDAQAGELRRIERDLHDGTQARLVALMMNLALAEQLMLNDPQAAHDLVTESRRTAGTALGELRDVVRGIHPPILADRGLSGGIRALAMSAGLPVEITVDLPDRLGAPLESALYFTAAELLTNAAKYSRATNVTMCLTHTQELVRLRVCDNGRGGADPTRGTGLNGLSRRLAAFDGRLSILSPPGGPTSIEVSVPCAS